MDLLTQRLSFNDTLTWKLLKSLCIPLWLKSESKLKQLIETIAKVEFKLFNDQNSPVTKQEHVCLWYVLT